MKITDLKSQETSQIGDTILSSRDLSDKFLNRTNQLTLNKIEYPELWELYKVSSGDRFIDKKLFNITSSTQRIDFIETENNYMVLQSPNILDFKFYNKNLNLLSSKPSGLISNTFPRKICGDNENVVVFGTGITGTIDIYYSNNFNIDNEIVGVFTSKVINSSNIYITFVNNDFIISVSYLSNTLIFKLNKNNISRIQEISGDFINDSLLDFILINSSIFISTNNLLLTDFQLSNTSIAYLENGDIYIYNSIDKKVVKTNQSNPYFLEIYENLVSEVISGSISCFCYYKNSFIMVFKKTTASLTNSIYLINDDGIKIKNDSNINNNIDKPSGFSGELFYIDFINKKIITPGQPNLVYYSDFSMNTKSYNVFNNTLVNTSFNMIGTESLNQQDLNIFINKNPVFMRIASSLILENGSNQYDTFRADFVLGTFPDNFTMPAIVGNTKDQYWTKKEK